MTVCVALAVRNGERYLAGAIESVLGQEGADLELRIVDNRSTDRSVEIARSYGDPRVSVVINERDLGYYGSLNRALRETDADLFVPFADDDLLAPGNLTVKAAALAAAPEAGFVYGPVILIDADDREGLMADRVDGLPDVVPAAGLLERIAPLNDIGCPGTTVIRTAALRALGGFDETLPYCADWQAWLLLALRHPVAIVREPLVRYRCHDGSGTSAARRDGSYAAQEVRALREALADPVLPAEWAARAPELLAMLCAHVSRKLRRDGHVRRSAGGPAAYAFGFEAVVLQPQLADAYRLFRGLCADTGLTPPVFPLDAVSAPEPAAVPALVAAARTLDAAGLLGSLAVAGDADALAPPLIAELESGPDVAVDLVGGASLESLLRPGAVVLGGAHAAAAEGSGVPAVL